MKQRPILFSTSMVQAIIAGNKTMTRRIVKFPKDFTGHKVFPNGTLGLKYSNSPDTLERLYCPYGKPGDILWVRESWALPVDDNGDDAGYQFKADYDDGSNWWKWKPSIHMPKAACRIWLEITDIRVERLQDISDKDAKKEGVELQPNHKWKNYMPNTDPKEGFSMPFSSFETLWKSINGGDSWNSNPWVWVVEFKRIEKPV